MKTWEIEKFLKEDIREKKKIGSGAFHMRGKGVRHGFNGALRTPYHFLKEKDRKKLSGEVETFNMFETIIPLKEFRLKTEEQQKNLLIKWREIYPTKLIKEQMGISNKPFYDLLAELKIETDKRKSNGEKIRKAKIKSADFSPPPLLSLEETPKMDPIKIISSGLHLEYNGSYDSDQLNKIFTKLQLLTDGEESKFVLSLSISERI
jgi:hypothetical protein